MQEIWAQSLGQEDSLEKGMAPHSSIFTWKIPWTEKPGGLLPGAGILHIECSTFHSIIFQDLE